MLAMVRSRLPSRLASIAETAITTSRDPMAAVPLDDAEALLFELDSIFGGGAGMAFETAGRSLAARILTEGSVRAAADLAVAARVLRAHLEQAFDHARLFYEIEGGDTDVALTLGVPGRARSARVLRHLVIGYLKAAATAAGLSPSAYRISSEILGDRASIKLSSQLQTTQQTRVPARRRSSANMRIPGTLAEVERILGGSSAPPPSRASGAWPTIHDSSPEIEDRPSEERSVAKDDAADEPRPSRRGSA